MIYRPTRKLTTREIYTNAYRAARRMATGAWEDRDSNGYQLFACYGKSADITNAAIVSLNAREGRPLTDGWLTDEDAESYYEWHSEQAAERAFYDYIENRGWQEAELEARRGFGH